MDPPPASPAPSASPHRTPRRTPRGGRGGRRSEPNQSPSSPAPSPAPSTPSRGRRGASSPHRGPSTPKSPGARSAPRGRSDADAPRRGGGRDRRERAAKPALTKEELDEGLRTGRYYSGLLRVNPSTRKTEAYVVVPGFARDVLVTGTAARGRAFDGDTVAVELFEYNKWQLVSAPAPDAALAASDSEDDEDDVDADVPTSPAPAASPSHLAPPSASLHAAVSERLAATPASAPVAVPRADDASLAASPFIAAPASSPVAPASPALAASLDDDESDSEPDAPATHFAHAVAPPSPMPGVALASSAPAATPAGGEGEVRRPTGRIVAVLEAGHQELFAGTIRPCGRRDKKDAKSNGNNGGRGEGASGVVYTDRMAFFVPLERRCPKLLVRLPSMTPHSKMLAEFNAPNNLFVAKLTGWLPHSSLPHAQLLSLLGDATQPQVQHDALTVTHDLPRDDFPRDALAAVPPSASRDVQPDDVVGRRDLRAECVFTIDPSTARDLDDALHVKELPGGLTEVGIHIADVSHFLRPGTALDREARRRATSVYLVHKVIPMLPRLLCEHACSLNPGADRLAFSVVVTLNAEGVVHGEPWFGRTVIHSAAKLSYDSAQALLDGAAPPAAPLTAPSSRYNAEHLRAAIRRLHALSLPMRRRRYEAGALSLGSSKLVFALDAQGQPTGVGTYAIKDTNRLIEEFMLLANVAVARRIARAFPQGALLRRHAAPPENKLAEMAAVCAKLGAPVNVSSAGALHASLEALRAGDATLHMVVQHLCTKPMQTAKYVATDPALPPASYAHYALSFAQYTHFTSPIRRYADVAVHRLLAAALEGGASPFGRDEIEAVVATCNRRKMNADKASDDCDYLYLCRYLQTQAPPPVEEALVLELSAAKSWVVMLLPRYDIEEMLFLRDLKAEESWSADGALSLAWKDAPPLTLRVMSRVQVRLLVNTEIKPLAIRLELVRHAAPQP